MRPHQLYLHLEVCFVLFKPIKDTGSNQNTELRTYCTFWFKYSNWCDLIAQACFVLHIISMWPCIDHHPSASVISSLFVPPFSCSPAPLSSSTLFAGVSLGSEVKGASGLLLLGVYTKTQKCYLLPYFCSAVFFPPFNQHFVWFHPLGKSLQCLNVGFHLAAINSQYRFLI